MSFIENAVGKLIRGGTVLGAIAMAVVTLIIVATVVARIFGYALAGTYDLIETIAIILGAFAFVYCELERGHVKAEVIVNRLSFSTQARLRTFTVFVSLAYWGVLLYACYRITARVYVLGEQTDLLGINIVPFRVVWLIALALMCLLLLFRLLHTLKTALSAKGSLEE